MSGVIGIVIGLMIGFLLGGVAGVAYFTGWSNGWDDCKKFIYTELDKRDDKTIAPLVRMMAEKLRGGEDDKS